MKTTIFKIIGVCLPCCGVNFDKVQLLLIIRTKLVNKILLLYHLPVFIVDAELSIDSKVRPRPALQYKVKSITEIHSIPIPRCISAQLHHLAVQIVEK